ncbi:cytochrome c oxidase subunit II [Longispora albida]|uniref:aa3-type cytochrome oxidase subunit II n=1 Tax=Longispora albida TaxID=203523 RepID=UPI00039BAEA5|nr:cytochrome c oxidase subunit II [Longispora albida]
MVGGGVALASLLGGCTVDDAFSFGWPKGGITEQSKRMYDMWIGSTIAALVIGVLVWALIFWCIVRYRKKGDALPPQTRYNMPMEALYSILPFLIVAVLFYYTAITETFVNKHSGNPDVRVEVTAFKWNWKFSYLEGAEKPMAPEVSTVGSSDYIPVVVVPVGKKILFTEKSTDVIHSFWVPELLFKRDVIPGAVNSFEVTINKTGAYVGRCAELCGTYHSMMNFELRAVTPEQYDKFIAAKKAGKSTPDALEAAGEARLATTTQPFDTSRVSRTTS